LMMLIEGSPFGVGWKNQAFVEVLVLCRFSLRSKCQCNLYKQI